MEKDTSLIIVAAGNATRMNGIDKIVSKIGEKSVIEMTMEAFEKSPSIRDIVVVTRKDLIDKINEIAKSANITKYTASVIGGQSRQESVRNGLNMISKETEMIAIHDGARPLVRTEDIENVIKDARVFGAATLGVPVKDTVKVVEDDFITDTPYRPSLFYTQTPQVFKRQIYFDAVNFCYEHGIENLTDDCGLVETTGRKVYMTKGHYDNIKITTPGDLKIAEVLAND